MRGHARSLVGTLIALGAAFVAPSVAVASITWTSISVDGYGSGGPVTTFAGEDTSIVTWGGALHGFYCDAEKGDLYTAKLTPAVSGRVRLDGAGGTSGRIDAFVGCEQAATAWNGAPRVFYRDETNGNLRVGTKGPAGWRFTTLDGNGGTAGRRWGDIGSEPFVTSYGKQLRVFYLDEGRHDLRMATLSGGVWSFTTVDGNGGGAGRIWSRLEGPVRASVFSGGVHVWYRVAVDDGWKLREAVLEGRAWSFGYPVGQGIEHTYTFSLAKVSDTSVYLFRSGTAIPCPTCGEDGALLDGSTDVRFARWDGSSWTVPSDDVVDANTPFAVTGITAVVRAGVPHVVYSSFECFGPGSCASALSHAVPVGPAWSISPLEQYAVDVGPPAAATVFGGRIHVLVGGSCRAYDADPEDPLSSWCIGTSVDDWIVS